MFELMDGYSQTAIIKVIGVGGGGGNAVAHMVNQGIEGVDFICANTDSQALKCVKVKTGLQIGCNITKGLGAGANPDVGRQAAMEDRDRIQEVIEGADMLLVKPAGAYLDVIREVRARYELPLAAYQVSGEYAMLKAAAQNGWLDERRAALESLVAIRRAGADLIITYYAKEAARWLASGDA